MFLRFQVAIVVIYMCDNLETAIAPPEVRLHFNVFFIGSPVPVIVSSNITIKFTIRLNICFSSGLVSTRRHYLGRVEQFSNGRRPSANSRHHIHLRSFTLRSSYQSPRNTSGCDRPLSPRVKVDIHGIQRCEELVQRLKEMRPVAFLYYVRFPCEVV